jgi:glucose-1-phosphate cytidylyltransferase
VVCLGYKGYLIKEYFANYLLHISDVTLDIAGNRMEVHQTAAEPWWITLVDTGEHTQTGARLKLALRYVDDDGAFCFTYGDGVADIDVGEQTELHHRSGVLATVTAVQPAGRFGTLEVSGDRIMGFQQKPAGNGGWINGVLFVLSPAVGEYVEGDASVWEREPLGRLAADGQLAPYKHTGIWRAMDTMRDRNDLEELWRNLEAPWTSGAEPGLLAWPASACHRSHWLQRGVALALAPGAGRRPARLGWGRPTHPALYELAEVGRGMRERTETYATLRASTPRSPTIVRRCAAPGGAADRQPRVGGACRDLRGECNGHSGRARGGTPAQSVRAVVVVTSDKVYDTRDSSAAASEGHPLGGSEPYSTGKACAELVAATYLCSYFKPGGRGLATARAGNVVGGGDWDEDRLVPDVMRAAPGGRPARIRRPGAVRPWQHVLDALGGYLLLAERLWDGGLGASGGETSRRHWETPGRWSGS